MNQSPFDIFDFLNDIPKEYPIKFKPKRDVYILANDTSSEGTWLKIREENNKLVLVLSVPGSSKKNINVGYREGKYFEITSKKDVEYPINEKISVNSDKYDIMAVKVTCENGLLVLKIPIKKDKVTNFDVL